MEGVKRLNYIGSKFKLLEWITETIQTCTGWKTFENRCIGDIFAGTGIVSYHFRSLGAAVVSNDSELYSSIITRAMNSSVHTDTCRRILEELNRLPSTVGYVTRHYSPYEGNERMFFTVDNAMRIDAIRQEIEHIRPKTTDDEYTFLLASLLVSADNVSNVPADYGCYLKEFKAKALKPIVLHPIHTLQTPAKQGSSTSNRDVLGITDLRADVVYLDPPYNERQYSKNYFPLNIIAKRPVDLETEPPLKGKTGIPTDCFVSPFCKKGTTVQTAFDTLFRQIDAPWILLSYSSEGIVPKDTIVELMSRYGTVTVYEQEYKRFKSFEYNENKPVTEYLFCLHKSTARES